jgi:HAD superfamily hydrolase (TIGR01509 family)
VDVSIKALLFDVDGTLADTEEAHRRAFNAAFAEMSLPFVWSVAEYEQLLLVAGGKERLSHFFSLQNLSIEEKTKLTALLPSLHRLKNEKYAELVAKGNAPFRPGVARLIDEAEAAGVKVGLATTTSAENVTALLQAGLGANADARFAVIACGDVVKAKKPAPDVYELALSKLSILPDEAIAFEDSEAGLSAAKSAGIFTVVTPTHWTRSQNFDRADLNVPHLGDPSSPLNDEAAARAGGSMVTLETLRSIRNGETVSSSRKRVMPS